MLIKKKRNLLKPNIKKQNKNSDSIPKKVRIGNIDSKLIWIMTLILNGSLEHVAHVWTETDNLIY